MTVGAIVDVVAGRPVVGVDVVACGRWADAAADAMAVCWLSLWSTASAIALNPSSAIKPPTTMRRTGCRRAVRPWGRAAVGRRPMGIGGGGTRGGGGIRGLGGGVERGGGGTGHRRAAGGGGGGGSRTGQTLGATGRDVGGNALQAYRRPDRWGGPPPRRARRLRWRRRLARVDHVDKTFDSTLRRARCAGTGALTHGFAAVKTPDRAAQESRCRRDGRSATARSRGWLRPVPPAGAQPFNGRLPSTTEPSGVASALV